MKTNKLKQISCAIMGSLMLASCDNNVGGTQQANSNLTSPMKTQITQASNPAKVTPETGAKPVNYIRESIIDSFAGNFFAFPGNFAFNLLSSWLGGYIFQDDTQQQVFDTLKDIQNKLLEMDQKLEKSLSISNDTLRVLGEFYHRQMGDNLWETLQQPQQSANFIRARYTDFNKSQAFGSNDIKADELDKLYNYALSQCGNKQIFDAIGARSEKSTQALSLSQNNISMLYNDFVSEYASPISGGAGEFYNQLRNRKQNYIDALFTDIPSSDFMSKIDYYNYQNMLYKNTLIGSYQQLYNMQLTQLAYKYACGANIKIVSPQLNQSWQGKTGFTEAAKALNIEYNQTYQQLQNNLESSFTLIQNQELYSRVNKLFNTELLDNSSFNSNQLTQGQCSLTGLVFEKLDELTSNTHGIARITAKCMLEQNADKTARFSTVKQDVPYRNVGTQITGTPYNHLRFDVNYPKMLVFTNRNKDSFGTDDVKVLTTNNEISNAWSWCDVGNVNRMADSWFDDFPGWNNVLFYWSAAQVDLADDVSIFSERYLAGYDNLIENARWGLPVWGYGLCNSGYSSLIKYPGAKRQSRDNTSPMGWYAQWHLLSYNGKQALLKVEFLNSSTERQWIGIGCMNTFGDQSCHRDPQDRNTLVWDDGTRLTLNGQMQLIPEISQNNNWEKLSGNWSIVGSAPESYEVLPKK